MLDVAIFAALSSQGYNTPKENKWILAKIVLTVNLEHLSGVYPFFVIWPMGNGGLK